MNYFIKHEDKKVAVINIDDTDNIARIEISNNSDTLRYLPINVKDKKGLSDWVKNRGIPVTRQDIKFDLKNKSTFRYMMENLGLSLTDHYWLCPVNEDITWKQINLYKNDFKSAYSLDLCHDISGKTNFIPSASLKGDLKKKWIIDENGVRRLVKGNCNDSCRQSISEVFATEIHKKQGKYNSTPYELIKISSNGKKITGCQCPNFTSIDTEFIPAIDIVNSRKKPNDKSYYEFYIQICYEHGLNIRYLMEYQILTDFVISNSDRHLNNFGILRNSKSLNWLQYAPIFDSGNSLFYKSGIIPMGKDLLELGVTSFSSQETGLLKYVRNRGIVDINKLPACDDLYTLLQKDKNTAQDTNENIVKAYQMKIRYLEDFQNGADIWSYTYRKKSRQYFVK
ncbi:MAG: hypothetical protein HFH68_01330 [Lachnospiraceae bacterium]|nr:hypothetical protein [Lachnospiraceae bacterium]